LKLEYKRAELPRSPLLNVAEYGDRFVGIFKIALESMASVKDLSLAMAARQEIKGKVCVSLYFLAKSFMRLTTEPPISKNELDEKV